MDKVEECKEIGAVYRLLSRVFISEVDAEFLGQLRTPCFYKSLKSIGIDFGPEFLVQDEKELLEDLACEYTSLFIMPGDVPPYESVYIEGQLMGEVTSRVKSFYYRYGLSPSSNIFPDHIGVELEFMSALKRKEAELWEKGGGRLVEKVLDLEKEFLSEHLGKWGPIFCEEVSKKSRHPFYQEMAHLTKEFIKFE